MAPTKKSDAVTVGPLPTDAQLPSAAKMQNVFLILKQKGFHFEMRGGVDFITEFQNFC